MTPQELDSKIASILPRMTKRPDGTTRPVQAIDVARAARVSGRKAAASLKRLGWRRSESYFATFFPPKPNA